MKTTFAGTLRKCNISYYFEVKDTDVYIEKNDDWKPSSCEDAYGHFTLEEGRKCYKALLNKGFKVVEENYTVYIESGTGIVKRELITFDTEIEAETFCREHNWCWLDDNGYLWDLTIDETKASR